MNLKYLLDANAISHLMRDPTGKVAMLALSRGIDRVCTSIIVAGELWLGAEKSNSSRLRLEVRAVLARTPILELSSPVDRVYAEVRNGLQSKGTPIGANDLWIAAHALAEGLLLVTDDEVEFARVEGLAIENWLRYKAAI